MDEETKGFGCDKMLLVESVGEVQPGYSGDWILKLAVLVFLYKKRVLYLDLVALP